MNPYFEKPQDTSGEFIGYKATITDDGKLAIVKLLIPSDALRVITGRNCRSDRAKVLDIRTSDGGILTKSRSLLRFNNAITYRVGEEVYADEFDCADTAFCTHGIHFFLTIGDAVGYGRYFIRR